MFYENYLKDNVCFIVPNNLKKEILFYTTKNKILKDISFYSISELKEKLFFKYDEKAIYYLSKKLNINYDDSKLLIDNLYYFNDIDSNDEKYLKLKEIKKYLEDNKLLSTSIGFLKHIKNKTIITTYSKTSFLNDKIFSVLDNIIFIDEKSNKLDKVYEFDFIEDEIEFIAYKIANLIENGTDINKIKLVNVSSEYINTIKKIFNYYNIPINLNENISLYDLKIIKEFILELKNNSKEKALEKILNSTNNIEIYNKITEVLNSLYFIEDLNKDIDFVIKCFKNTMIKKENLKNSISCIKPEEMYNSDNYYFMIGFNSSFPKLFKDEDYLSDNLKIKLNFSNSSTINKNIKNYYINKIKNMNNLTLTYKTKDYFNSYLVSPLISDLQVEVIKNPQLNIIKSYSNKLDEIKLAKNLDNYYKYSIINDNLGILLNNYDKDKYNSYDNSFKGIDKKKYLNTLNNKLTLSYSSLDNYYKCNFKYYINNLLKEKETTFSSIIGNLFHYLLSKMYDKNFEFEKEYSHFLSDKKLSAKEEVLLIKLKKEIIKDIQLIKEQINKSNYKLAICEKNLSIEIKSKISVNLIGYIDKILLNTNNNSAYVVDYKTGKAEISFDNLENGLGMQLAIYMYLMNKSKEYADIFLVGCYLQRILLDDPNLEELKLEGYTFNDINIIREIDNQCDEKSFIKGLKIKKSGELSNSSKIFDSDYYQNILNIVEDKIKEAVDGITNASFTINPKIVKGINISCKYCKYNDICYHSYKDSVIISGGDEDEQELD